MKISVLLALITLALYMRFCSAEAGPSDVVVLSDNSLDEQLAQGQWLVEFYAPWCGHCKNLAPTWEQLATTLKGTVNVGKVDCTVERATASRFAISGFPTIKFFKDGKMYDYSGARTVDAFTTFSSTGHAAGTPKEIPVPKPPPAAPTPAAAAPAADKAAPAAAAAQQQAAAAQQASAGQPSPASEKAPSPPSAAAADGKPTPSLQKPSPSTAGDKPSPADQQQQQQQPSAAKAAPPAADKPNPHAERAAAEPSKAAATGASDVVVLTQQNFDTQVASGDWLLEFYAPWCGHCKVLAPIYEQVATALKGRVNVGKIDCTVEQALATRFGITGYPTIKFLKDKQIYSFKGARTLETFVEFADQGYATAGAASPFPPAAADPAPPAAAPAATEKKEKRAHADAGTTAPAGVSDVIVLTDATFDERTVLGDWLVEFYAPWCGHCQRLKPIYEQVATALKDTVSVAKVDCTVEKGVCEQHEVAGYPTITYFHNGKRYQFGGARTLDGFKEFVNGGWQQVTAEDLPAPRSIFKEYAIRIVQQIETQFSNNIYYIFGACIGVGILLGLLIVVLAPKPRARDDKPKHE